MACVTGVDTAGKTRFARALADALEAVGRRVQLVHADDFHRPRAERYTGTGDEADAYYERSFDLPLLIDRVLEPARAERSLDVTLELLDVVTDRRDVRRSYRAGPDAVLLVEGVFLLRPELRHYWDFAILLEAPAAVVHERARDRDVPVFGDDVLRKYRDKYLPAQGRYTLASRPRERAHVVIDNADWREPRILGGSACAP
jgi:uridine kinase